MKKRTGIAMQGVGMIGILIGGSGLDGSTPAAAAAVVAASLLILIAGDAVHKVCENEKEEKAKRQDAMFRTWVTDTDLIQIKK